MTFTLTIQGLERPIQCSAQVGQSVRQAMSEGVGVILGRCGGYGACGTCVVRVEEGEASPPNDVEAAYPYLAPGERLACQTLFAGAAHPVTITVL